MKFKKAIVALATLMLASCVQSVTVKTPFNTAEHEFAAKPGKATVSAQAFMRRNDGMVVYAAGSNAMLLPASSYVRELYDTSQKVYGAPPVTNLDIRLKDYTKIAQANGEGRFSFHGVPDGEYLVVTNVNWRAGDSTQGGDLTKFITVSNGQNVDVILTR
ncbi:MULTISPECIES: hypothetical protein [Agrobacterium]|uniref:hypothetical protein n=1 Tax=Agrobacterium TaxID=357 RepID=UPI0009D5331A|nr:MULTISPECIES: hypothetical protein [Agrobacterium]QCL72132.1 carboxypeptidase-like regulatory domain-containing protein [Agrobacterium tumefaciens]CUX23895.1 conserved exported hypothetical protein [Agrobacterium sp. NCPPB 925]